MVTKTYFIAPNLDIAPPPDGLLDLGHIISGPRETDIDPINQDGHIQPSAPDGKALPKPTFKQGFTSTRNKLLTGEVGFWAHVVASLGIHASLGFSHESDFDIKVDRLETRVFSPSDDYVRQALAAPEVVQYLIDSEYQVPLYMITGLKIARGASMKQGENRWAGLSMKGTFPLEGSQVGPKAEGSGHTKQGQSFKESSDFVLAFRVRRIRFRSVQGKPEMRDNTLYVKGATMHAERSTLVPDAATFDFERLDDGASVPEVEWQYVQTNMPVDDEDRGFEFVYLWKTARVLNAPQEQ